MYMDNVKLFLKNEKELETDKNNKNRQPGYRNGIWHRKMCHVKNKKGKKTNNRKNRGAKLGKKQNAWREGKFQVLGSIRSREHQTIGDERKNKQKFRRKKSKLQETKLCHRNLIK